MKTLAWGSKGRAGGSHGIREGCLLCKAVNRLEGSEIILKASYGSESPHLSARRHRKSSEFSMDLPYLEGPWSFVLMVENAYIPYDISMRSLICGRLTPSAKIRDCEGITRAHNQKEALLRPQWYDPSTFEPFIDDASIHIKGSLVVNPHPSPPRSLKHGAARAK